jgi:hypothetical protein
MARDSKSGEEDDCLASLGGELPRSLMMRCFWDRKPATLLYEAVKNSCELGQIRRQTIASHHMFSDVFPHEVGYRAS